MKRPSPNVGGLRTGPFLSYLQGTLTRSWFPFTGITVPGCALQSSICLGDECL